MIKKPFVIVCATAVLVVASIWYELFAHYYVPKTVPSDALIETLREQPSDSILEELSRAYLGKRPSTLPALPPESPTGRLLHAGLFGYATTLDEFRRTGDSVLLQNVATELAAFAKRANQFFVFDDFLWNDHAISNRIFIISSFWQAYRNHDVYDEALAREIIQHLIKNIDYLKREDHFTYWTNHGIMQSIALLHAANAFPGLPDREQMVDLALSRLQEQMDYFVSDSGWITEHSAGYQEFGVNLFERLEKEIALLDRRTPESWRAKIDRARKILDLLIRPDGSIPNIGDSGFSADVSAAAPAQCRSRESSVDLWARDGYLIAWDTNTDSSEPVCAQTVVTWANFISDAHGRDNQLSVHYWNSGTDYVKSSGYWPYGDSSRNDAIGWLGSNAPHLAGEASQNRGDSAVHGFCTADSFWLADIERSNPDSEVAIRRQIVGMGLQGLIILDNVQPQTSQPLQSVWRLDDRVQLAGFAKESRDAPAAGSRSRAMFVTNASVADVADDTRLEGSPVGRIAGAVSLGRKFPMQTYLIASAEEEPTLLGFWDSADGGQASDLVLDRFESPEQWTVRVVSAPDTLVLDRRGPEIEVLWQGSDKSQSCALRVIGSQDRDLTAMENAFSRAADKYSIFKAWVPYRGKLTYAAVGLLLVQMGILGVLAFFRQQLVVAFTAVSVTAWLAFAAYVHVFYLAL